jgi:hypothetical protein
MATESVTFKGDRKVLNRLKKAGDNKRLRAAVTAAAIHVKGKVAIYPPRKLGRAGNFVSARQKRQFAGMVRQGYRDFPYKRGISGRSERHGQSWTYTTAGSGLSATVGSDTSYGQLLQSPKHQTAFHRAGGWKTIEEVMKEEQPKVLAFFKAELDRALSS